MSKRWFAIFDGRYRYDEDAAMVLDTADDLEGAWNSAEEFGPDCVVVELEDRADGISYPINTYLSRQQQAAQGGEGA